MPLPDKIEGLMTAVTQSELDAMAPAARRRFADLCRHMADRAEPRRGAPKSGVLARLKEGERAQ
jgi:hypothetical protein